MIETVIILFVIIVCLILMNTLQGIAALIIFGFLKRKFGLAIISTLILVLPVAFYIAFPTEFPYVDFLLYDKTKDEVIEIYGEPEYDGETIIGYYIGVDNRGLDPSGMDLYYYLEFNDDGDVCRIFEGVQPSG